MNPITINSTDTSVQDFKEGHPIQVRVNVKENEMKEYRKGATVKVICEDIEATGRIVSEPLELESKEENTGKKTLSLIIEKP
jgi:hypothetical protein